MPSSPSANRPVHHGRSTSRALLSEAWSNLWAWRTVTIPFAILIAVISGFTLLRTANDVASAQRSARSLDEQGRQVLFVRSAGSTLSARSCERVRSSGSVRTAFALAAETEVVRTSLGSRVTLLEVSPSFVDFVETLATTVRPDSVLVGESLAERSGLVDGALLSVERDGTTRIERVTVLSRSPRTGFFDDAVVVIDASDFGAERCVVEAEPGHRPSISESLPSLFAANPPAVVEPFDPVLESNTTPERELAASGGDVGVVGAGLLMGLLVLASWYVRRAEWAIYRSLGLRLVGIAAMALIEWIVLIGVPIASAGLWTTLAAPTDTGSTPVSIGAWNLVAAASVAFLAVPAWITYAALASTLQELKDP